MKDMTKKVLILNNFTSPYIQQAIIILRRHDPENETRIILEAEHVIEDYFRRERGEGEDSPAYGALAAIIASGLVITCLAVYGAVQLITKVI